MSFEIKHGGVTQSGNCFGFGKASGGGSETIESVGFGCGFDNFMQTEDGFAYGNGIGSGYGNITGIGCGMGYIYKYGDGGFYWG